MASFSRVEPAEIKSPLSPEESLKHFQLDPLLSIELVAAEPEVMDPVAMRFDEDGRLWVAEMRDYPLGPIKKKDGNRTEKDAEPLSRIKVLEDRDGDGRFETSTVFADKLLFVTGLQPWKGGVIVTLSGKVAYMKDTDGDGKADVNETWFTGFSESNSQLRANHPTFALDNHIYIANGLRGGMVVNHLKKLLASGGRKPPDTKEKETGDRKQEADDAPINISGMDFRFDPLTGEAEAVSGNGQFGLCFDDWGNRFVCSNRNPCQHVVIENRYLKKAPTVAIPSVVQDVAAFAENSRIYPISKFWTTSNLHEGQFTAACGVFIYRGDLLPQEFRGNVVTCDPTGNLIHREIMEAKGATFTSKPAYEGKEFLASPDTWFRPVAMELGPDGALYVVDMYRAVIEHPEWVPDELKNRPDERLGDDRGRIYRIVPKERDAAIPVIQKSFSKSKTEKLVETLEQPNAWQREAAQRLLLERQEKSAMEGLKRIVTGLSQDIACTHAIWTLKGLGEPLELVAFSKKLPSPQLACQLLIISEGKATTIPDYASQTLPRHSRLEFQTNLSVLYTNDKTLNDSVKTVSPADEWIRQSIKLRWKDGQVELFSRLIQPFAQTGSWATREGREFTLELAREAGQNATDAQLVELLRRLLINSNWKGIPQQPFFAYLVALAKGLKRRGATLEAIIAKIGDDDLKKALPLVKAQCLQVVEERKTGSIFSDALELLGCVENGTEPLAKVALNDPLPEARRLAIQALAHADGADFWPWIVKGYSSQPTSVRTPTIDAILQRPERISLLLDSLESGSIKAAELDPVQTGRLLKHGEAKIRERAEKIFGSATPEDRKKALADYQTVLTMTGDAKRGQVSFAKNCATCHKIGETGVNVAPDISDSRTKTPAQILADIIQPNRAIDANYVAYNLLLADGTTASGILTSETSTSITLKAAGAKVITVARGEIEQLKSTGISLMPDGLEKTIPPQEMADVIAFIKNWRYLDGRVPVK